MPDALASNAGDRYHFIYAARRMLDMLHPRSGLELIVMENVAEEDRLWADSPETFLAADLTEYSGGRNTTEASKIVIVQVKYSPTNPNGTWTLNRLCQNKKSSTGNDKPGTSVLRKLANAFNAIYSELGETTRDKLKVKLFTNQNLADDLRKHLAQAQTLLAGRTGTEGSRLLRNTPAELRDTLERLQQGTTLSWKRLATFLQCWDLSGFGQAMYRLFPSSHPV